MSPTEKLQNVINIESKRVNNTFSGPSYHAVQNIIRRLDVILPFYWGDNNTSLQTVNEFRAFYKFGWAPFLKNYYNKLDINLFQSYPLMDEEAIQWADANIVYTGKIEFCKQLLMYEKAGLIQINLLSENVFKFSFLKKLNGIEQFDGMSKDFYKDKIVGKNIEEKKQKDSFDTEKIKKQLKSIIKSPDNKLISYNTTPEIDDYYNRQGYYQILKLQGYDDFDATDSFGSIPYSKYLDIIELITGVSLMHQDACIELVSMNNRIDIHNVLSYTYFKDKTIELYSTYLGMDKREIEQIFSCITLSKNNYEYYLDFPATPPPMYFQVSDNLIIRTIAGCLDNPIALLNRELKRNFKNDYDKAVNRRESRFREELFILFPQERIIKIHREININFDGIKTDIDAVLFDTTTGSLGLFQLKWQDPFSHSMIERFSRMSNLFPKANEWINKIKLWIDKTPSNSMLNALQIDKIIGGNYKIENIFIFVLTRHHINFTGVEINNDAAWSSWYQLIESQARIKSDFDDPIKEMYYKINSFQPKMRVKLENLPKAEDMEVSIGKYKIIYKA